MTPRALPTKSAPNPLSSRWNRGCLSEVLVVVAVVLVYWNSLHSPFLFDDLGAVENNPTIRQLWPVTDALHPPSDGSTTTGRPILNLTFALNYALSANTPTGYHAGNILIHAAAALALLGLARRTLVSPTFTARFATTAGPLAFCSALLWAMHPLLTESVTCIAQRSESLFGLFFLATLYGFARGLASPNRWQWFAFSVVSCWLGMGTKEAMVSAPLVTLLYDRTFVAGSFSGAWRQRRGYYLALASAWLLLGWLVLAGHGTRGLSAGTGLGISWWAYGLKQSEAILLYLKLAVWPHPLVLDYGTAVVESITAVWWQLLLVLALVAWTGWALWRRPIHGFFGACFFIILAPSSSVVPLITQTMAEHRMYLPLAGLCCGLVPLIYHWLGRVAWPALGTLTLACGALTIARNDDYRSVISIWQDTVEHCPSNGRAFINLGIELGKAGRDQAALSQFARAIQLNAESVVSGHYQAGAINLKLGRVDVALEHLESAVRLAPNHADAQFTLANALVQADRPNGAVPHYQAALRVRSDADAHFNLGVTFALLERTTEAIEEFNHALHLNPDLVEAHYRLAKALQQLGRTTEAAHQFTATLQLAPTRAEVHGDYGIALARAGRLPEAIEHLAMAVQLKPDEAEAQANLGNALLMQSRVPEAIAHYEIALRLKPHDQRTQENLQLARETLRSRR